MSNKQNKKHQRSAQKAQFGNGGDNSSPKNFEHYREYTEKFDMNDDEAREFIRALQDIADSFVQMGWEGSDAIASVSDRSDSGGA